MSQCEYQMSSQSTNLLDHPDSLCPIRCMGGCHKVLCTEKIYGKYLLLRKAGVSSAQALDQIGLERQCCRTTIMTNIDCSPVQNQISTMEQLAKDMGDVAFTTGTKVKYRVLKAV